MLMRYIKVRVYSLVLATCPSPPSFRTMPLVERHDDRSINDGTFDDPHSLAFDHRIEADDASSTESGLANIRE